MHEPCVRDRGVIVCRLPRTSHCSASLCKLRLSTWKTASPRAASCRRNGNSANPERSANNCAPMGTFRIVRYENETYRALSVVRSCGMAAVAIYTGPSGVAYDRVFVCVVVRWSFACWRTCRYDEPEETAGSGVGCRDG